VPPPSGVSLHGANQGDGNVAQRINLRAWLKPGARVAIIDFRIDAPYGQVME
jgi:hypothetical protein